MNLGALCRTAEVFRLETVVLASLQWTQHQEFRKLAVSAERWQPLAECPLDDLSDWIRQQQASHIAVVALTRHPHAIALPQFIFPKQTVLLLGRELTGIPVNLVEQCNTVVEIPQYGRVDSLNVHTAAAIAAYAYLSQHAISRPSS